MNDRRIPDGVSEFVEETGLLLERSGFTRTGGRLVGWLLACEPAEQTAQDLGAALQSSAGGISTTLRALERGGFVERTAHAGDRRTYYRVAPDSWLAMEHDHVQFAGSFRAVLDECLARPDAPTDAARLERAREFFAFMEREIPALWQRFIEEHPSSVSDAPARR